MWLNYLFILSISYNFFLAGGICSGCSSEQTNNEEVCPNSDTTGEEPCKLDDYDCIAEILAATSYCFRSVNPYLPEEFTTVVVYDAPLFGFSSYIPFFTVIGLNNCEVSTFTTYMAYERMVLTITCPVKFIANQTVIRYDAAELPSTFETYAILAELEFEELTFTGDFRHTNELDLCSAFIFPFTNKPPTVVLKGLDTESQQALDENVFGTAGREEIAVNYLLCSISNKLFEEFVQRMICDFSCHWFGKDMHHPGKQNLQYSYLTDQIG